MRPCRKKCSVFNGFCSCSHTSVSLCGTMKKAIAFSNCFFQLYSPCGEWYCYAVIFGFLPSDICFASVRANIISLWALANNITFGLKLRQHRTIELSPKQKTSNHKRSDAFQNLLARQTSIKPPDRVCQLKSSLPKQTYYSFLRFAFATLGIASFESEAAA